MRILPFSGCFALSIGPATNMIKRILVALDPDSDTPIATRYAAEIARRHGAHVVGLAVVDTGQIEAAGRGGGVGSMYYAEKLKENLTEETRQKAHELIRSFEASMKDSGVPFTDVVEEGVPFQRIVEDMKYHDLLVVGKEPHFFYGHPDEKTQTLAKVVKETSAPTLVFGEQFSTIERVLVAYDGSAASARTVQFFAHLQPFGTDVQMEVVNVHSGRVEESRLIVRLMASYLETHGFSVRQTSVRGENTAEQISEYAQQSGADVVVAGAHAVSMLKRIAFGSTTSRLLKDCPKPLFLHH